MPANTPPALDPLIERIAEDLVQTIRGISARYTTEGGFYFRDYTADRPHPAAVNSDFKDGRVQIVQGLGEQQDEVSNVCSLGIKTYFTLRIDCIVGQRSGDSLDRKLNLRVADVLKAVLTDQTRGQLAITTDFSYADAPEETADLTKGRVDLVFTTQHQQSRTDPTAF